MEFIAPRHCSRIGGIAIEPHAIHTINIGVDPAVMYREATHAEITLRYTHHNVTYKLTLAFEEAVKQQG